MFQQRKLEYSSSPRFLILLIKRVLLGMPGLKKGLYRSYTSNFNAFFLFFTKGVKYAKQPKMSEVLEKIIKEKISADHLLYVSLKYTKTCDVMINLIRRWKIMIDYSIDGLLDKAKKKKMLKKIPTAPKIKVDETKRIFKKKPEIMQAIEIYEMFKLIEILQKSKENEFRKGVCLKIQYRGEEIRVDLEKLKEYSEILERFINYIKLFLSSKN